MPPAWEYMLELTMAWTAVCWKCGGGACFGWRQLCIQPLGAWSGDSIVESQALCREKCYITARARSWMAHNLAKTTVTVAVAVQRRRALEYAWTHKVRASGRHSWMGALPRQAAPFCASSLHYCHFYFRLLSVWVSIQTFYSLWPFDAPRGIVVPWLPRYHWEFRQLVAMLPEEMLC